MSQYDELKRLAEDATPGRNFDRLPMAGGGLKYECTGDDGSLVLKVDHKNNEWGFVGDNSSADEEFFLACTPAAVLALIYENERLEREAKNDLIAYKAAIERQNELRAEIAGLKTGYEAYERVNAELKAECEALRDDVEQNQYDANAWRNGEESVWIEVFNSEGDDPFISAITGQITVEQLALIQAEILEYREDYFEKGSGLYVFRCSHYQAHHDNVGMTEPAHWETDFESYSPFPWEEEAAAMGQGERP